ncbi:hypothetical protein GCM10009689_24300 [Brevibacterium antiquum]
MLAFRKFFRPLGEIVVRISGWHFYGPRLVVAQGSAIQKPDFSEQGVFDGRSQIDHCISCEQRKASGHRRDLFNYRIAHDPIRLFTDSEYIATARYVIEYQFADLGNEFVGVGQRCYHAQMPIR